MRHSRRSLLPKANPKQFASFPTTVSELLGHPGWDGFIGDKLGNDLFINDPDRAERNYDAAEHGEDGSTWEEHVEDWREFAQILEREARRKCETDDQEAELEKAAELLESDIERVEKWHEERERKESKIRGNPMRKKAVRRSNPIRSNHAADETVVIEGGANHTVDVDRLETVLTDFVSRTGARATFHARNRQPFKTLVKKGDLATVRKLVKAVDESPVPVHKVCIDPATSGGVVRGNPVRSNPSKDPTTEEMTAFLTKQFKRLLDKESLQYDVPVAIYWFANHYHGGQSSNLYSALSTSDYRPGRNSSLESEGDSVGMLYEALESQFGK